MAVPPVSTPHERAPSTSGPPHVQGMIAGIIGAVVLALWFLILDAARGKPLYTPSVLGAALLQGVSDSVDTQEPSLLLTFAYSVLHGLVFCVIGAAIANVLWRFESQRSLVLATLMVFMVLGFTFLAFTVSFAAMGSRAIFVRDVLIGNALAAAAMAVYLQRHLPAPRRAARSAPTPASART